MTTPNAQTDMPLNNAQTIGENIGEARRLARRLANRAAHASELIRYYNRRS